MAATQIGEKASESCIDIDAIRSDPEFLKFENQYRRAAGKRAAGVLYDLARELKKRPVLASTVESVAAEIDPYGDLAYDWPEFQASKRHPDDTIRAMLAAMPDRRQREGQAKVAEIVAERARINGRLDEVGDLEGAEFEEQRPEFDDLLSELAELNELTLRAISAGTVDPMAAAQAASGSEAF